VQEDDFDFRVSRIAALGDRVRRALYRYVVAQTAPVSRDQAAEGVDVPRHVAKFHLDKLEQDGLLETVFSRPPGRGGPGSGRPAKLYRRSTREVAVSLPERRYDLAGTLMARAITESQRDGVPVADALHRAAREMGRSLGEEARGRLGVRPSRARGAALAAVRDVLAGYGYEPRVDGDGLTLANCPFHGLAQDYTDLVCTMNLDLMKGLLDGLGRADVTACLDPAPDRCCVVLQY
jgi:predicted ArsR family transcriptional regulator